MTSLPPSPQTPPAQLSVSLSLPSPPLMLTPMGCGAGPTSMASSPPLPTIDTYDTPPYVAPFTVKVPSAAENATEMTFGASSP